MKGAILAVDPGAVIVDVTHGVTRHAIEEGSFLLSRVWDVFPPGTVFLVVVDPGVGGRRRNMIVTSAGRFFVGPDNGLVTDLEGERGIEGVHVIRTAAVERIRRHRPAGSTFLGRDVFAPVAAALAGGGSPSLLGRRGAAPKRVAVPRVDAGKGAVTGTVRYVDSFGNMLTGISRAHIERGLGRPALERIRVTVDNRVEIRGLRAFFAEGREGELIAILNSWGMVELTVNAGRAIDRFAGLAKVDVRIDAR
jgi:S-adenosylmethionine hydrolase